jgi:thioesterase domain-containing protein
LNSEPSLIKLQEMRHFDGEYLVAMQTEGLLPPLYFLHDIGGDVLIYSAIADCFAPERPVYGVRAPTGLEGSAERCTLESLAAGYVKEILARQPTGPFHLAGFSSGATLAFETARQLTAAEHRVGLLGLIDASANAPGPKLSKPARLLKIAVRKACKIIFKLSDELKEGPRQFVGKRVRYLWLTWRMKKLMQSPAPGNDLLPLEQILFLAENLYRPTTYSGSALLLRFRDEAWPFGPDPLMGWGGLVLSRLDVVDFPGGHHRDGAFPRAALGGHIERTNGAKRSRICVSLRRPNRVGSRCQHYRKPSTAASFTC